jgi:hypothetical protein
VRSLGAVQEHTNPDAVITAMRSLPVEGQGAAVLDGLLQALHMLGRRKPDRRRVVLVIAEKRDRSSRAPLHEVVEEA